MDLPWLAESYGTALLVAVGCCWPSPARAQTDTSSELARADSALAQGQLDRAVDLARDYTAHHAGDWRGWYVQGEATLRRGGSSNLYRLQAIFAFRHALRLAPGSAKVWGAYGRAGLSLGSADGESIVHEAYEKVLALDPLYPGAWENWLKAYDSRSDRARMRRILRRHPDVPEARAHIAQLLIRDESFAKADAVLDSLLALDPREPEWLALRAQSALEAGDATGGLAYYDSALANAGRPGGEELWRQVIGIATPGEIRAWEAGILPADRAGFLRGFWARRNPDLFAGVNERIAEHFARLRVAEKMFPDLHPLSSYKNRAMTRALDAAPSIGEQIFYARCEAQEYPGGAMRATDRAHLNSAVESLFADPGVWESWRHIEPPGELFLDPTKVNIGALDMPYGRNIQDIDTTAAALGYNLRTGLDDRGITYLRFGPPEKRAIGSPNVADQFCQLPDLEHWEYADIGTVRFFRPEAVVVGGAVGGWASTGGDEVFRPMNDRQFDATELVMTRNETSVPAPLSFGVWTAQFAGVRPDTTEVVVITTRGAAAAQLAALIRMAGPPVEDTTGVVVLAAPPGRYVLTTDAKLADTLGRQSERIAVQRFGVTPGVSDLLLAPAWPDTLTTRALMLRNVQRDLVFPSGTTVRAYAEVYGLRPSADGRIHYRVSYQIYPTSDVARDAQREQLSGGTRLSFDRDAPYTGRPITEWLNIAPSRLRPGFYILRVEVRADEAGPLIGRAQVGFHIVDR